MGLLVWAEILAGVIVESKAVRSGSVAAMTESIVGKSQPPVVLLERPNLSRVQQLVRVL